MQRPSGQHKDDSYFGTPRTEIEPLLPNNIHRVLEIGCGTGATMEWLRNIRQVKHAIGIELSPVIARKAQSVFNEVLVGNVENMDLTLLRQSLDAILALDVLEHLVDPWSVVRRCHELLKPGGVMIASIPNIGHYTVSLPLILRGLWSYEDAGLLDRTHLRFFDAKTAVELMTSSGLVLERTERVRKMPLWYSRIRTRRVRWYAQKTLRGLPSHLFDFQFLIRVQSQGPSQLP